ncbi:hypothetical protein [Duganella violaceipulchra]|uniref:Uncharacterized protein n=1 Tax=Duganella violaceipulchra TaxID=2849652 RepID=A0AA41L872_9BURK|nr:hypothetical protein [Duganella violaceicalia]MBV6321940.1 hypothetical protein [Duganella violaceicalia]MCP2007066.1 hypothetical protein [Duganella violaceicalia]
MANENNTGAAPGALPPLPNLARMAPHELNSALLEFGSAAWHMGLDVGLEHAPAVTDTGLLELRDHLAAAAQDNQAITLSPVAASALHHAMTTPSAASSPAGEAMQEARASLDEALASDELRQLKAEAQALAADGANWSMHVGCMFFLALIERIESLDTKPAGYIASQDMVKLGNCRAELWAAPPAADAVPVFLGAPAAPEGWQLVPKVPTPEMIMALAVLPDMVDGRIIRYSIDKLPDAYAAMLAVAPAAGTPP